MRSITTSIKNERDARIRELSRKRKDAVYQFLASQRFKTEKTLGDRIKSESIDDYVFRMKLYRWVIGRYVLAHLVREIDIIKEKENGLKHGETDIDRVRLTKALLISDRDRILRYMLLINMNLDNLRGAINYYRHKAHYKSCIKNDMDKLIKDQIFKPEAWL